MPNTSAATNPLTIPIASHATPESANTAATRSNQTLCRADKGAGFKGTTPTRSPRVQGTDLTRGFL